MAIRLGRKREEAQVPTPGNGNEGAAPRKLRENERLRSVLNESTFASAVEILQENDRFRLVPDVQGNPRWLALLLSAESIGGLSEKTKRDEAKGSLVNDINGGGISAIATEEMLDHEFFTIVPNQTTIERAEEYSLLTNAPYFWVVLSSVAGQLVVDRGIGPATFDQARRIASGESIESVVRSGDDGENTWARIMAGAGVAEPAPAETSEAGPSTPASDISEPSEAAEPDEALAAEVAAVNDTVAASDDQPIEVTDTSVDIDDEPAAEDFYAALAQESDEELVEENRYDELAEDLFDDEEAEEAPEQYDVEPEAHAEEVEQVPYTEYLAEKREVTEAEVTDTLARRFLSSDLDLRVDLAEFEHIFAVDAPLRLSVSVPEGNTDWLGSQVAALVERANDELAAARARNLASLRQLFVELSDLHMHKVNSQVALNNPDTQIGAMIHMAESERERMRNEAHLTKASKRREIEERINEEIEIKARAAAEAARAAAFQQLRGWRETMLAQVDREVEVEIETVYQNARQHALELRREEAALAMEQGKTMILQAVGKARDEHLAAEQALLERWSAKIVELIDENRKRDIARAEALEEELRRTNIVEIERNEAAARLEQVRAEHAAKVAELELRVEQARADAAAEISRIEQVWAERVMAEQVRVNESEQRIASLEQQWAERVNALKESRDSIAVEMEVTNASTKRMQQILIFLMVVLTITGLAIGAIIGWSLANQAMEPVSALLTT